MNGPHPLRTRVSKPRVGICISKTPSLLLCVLLAFAPVDFAQTTIREEVRQVLVPVVVIDKKGHHVTGLQASDFHVSEGGTA